MSPIAESPTEIKVVIPARLQSSRLAEKVLLPIAGRPMVEWVWRAAIASGVGEVVIATDHPRVVDAARAFGAEVCLTAADHLSGTDRCGEVAQRYGWAATTRVINLQGDEPQMAAACLRQLATLSARHSDSVASLYQFIQDASEWHDPAVVKVVCDGRGRALYFSRAPIPSCRGGSPRWDSGLYRRHIGLYAYPVALLREITQLPAAPYEAVEKLEQLRMLEAAIPIQMEAACEPLPAGVDTEADWQRVCATWPAAESG